MVVVRFTVDKCLALDAGDESNHHAQSGVPKLELGPSSYDPYLKTEKISLYRKKVFFVLFVLALALEY